jgi:hypothetical protein
MHHNTVFMPTTNDGLSVLQHKKGPKQINNSTLYATRPPANNNNSSNSRPDTCNYRRQLARKRINSLTLSNRLHPFCHSSMPTYRLPPTQHTPSTAHPSRVTSRPHHRHHRLHYAHGHRRISTHGCRPSRTRPSPPIIIVPNR